MVMVGSFTRWCLLSLVASVASAGWVAPDEEHLQTRTWMAFPAHWDAAKLDAVQGDVCKVAKTIAKHQPVSMLVESAHKDTAATLCGSTVDLVEVDIDDLWARDTAPVFVLDGGKLGAVDFNFNGWGGKQEHSYDAKVAAFVAGEAGAELITTWLTLEGGGLEVDGEGTAIVTESCVLNSNRNKDATKEDVEKELDKLLGIKKVPYYIFILYYIIS